MYKLEKPLYHGTSSASSVMIVGATGFKAPVYLTEDRRAAEHYAKAATAYLIYLCKEKDTHPITDGYSIFTFTSVPDENYLIVDDYSDEEPGQWKYLKSIRGLRHFTVERYPFDPDEEELMRLVCFAIGMWRK